MLSAAEYKQLLRKYMGHVRDLAGTSYVGWVSARTDFTQEEDAELVELFECLSGERLDNGGTNRVKVS